jgi:hypothetical protein
MDLDENEEDYFKDSPIPLYCCLFCPQKFYSQAPQQAIDAEDSKQVEQNPPEVAQIPEDSKQMEQANPLQEAAMQDEQSPLKQNGGPETPHVQIPLVQQDSEQASERAFSPQPESGQEQNGDDETRRMEQCLLHMHKHHGFFIPFTEYLVDLVGLLTYLGAKIGQGHICLYCNGRGRARYPTVAAVQQHMAAKSHCKLRIEDNEDEEEDEYLSFYQFDEKVDEEELPPAGDKFELVAIESMGGVKHRPSKRARGLAEIDDNGELILSDGSRIGHRHYRKEYEQNTRPVESRESVLIAQMMSRYRMIKQAGFGGRETSTAEEQAKRIVGLANKQRMQVGIQLNKVGRLRLRLQNPR